MKQQILVARGEKLAFTQEDLKIRGHALEVRVYAEDPRNNFLPDIGKLNTYKRPQGPGVRVDDGFEETTFVSGNIVWSTDKSLPWKQDIDS